MPTPPDGATDFREALYASYVSGHMGPAPEPRSRPGLLAHILRHVPADRETKILDVGCGQGQLVRLLESRDYKNVTGIDVSAEQVALAEKLGTQRVHQHDLFEHADRHRDEYGVVIAIDVVEHFERVAVLDAFRAIAALLEPGGMLILRTPNGSSPYCGRILHGDLTHGMAYTTHSLHQACAATGFASVRVFPVRPAGTGVKQLLRRASWAVFELMLKAPLIAETGELRGHIVTQNLVGVARKASR